MNWLLNTCTDAHYNMAFDEYCLDRYPSREPFFYLWRNAPAVIIGFNQNAHAEVNLEYLRAHGIKLARRLTGGGAVYHDLQNLNYTIVGKGIGPEPVVEALRGMGVDARLSGRNDIFVDGCKVSGYARRLGARREIIHGTLMYDVDIDTLTHVLDTEGSKLRSKGVASVRSRVANLKDLLSPKIADIEDFRSELQKALAGSDGVCMPFPDDAVREVERLRDAKFAREDWVFGSRAQAGVSRSRRFACGTVSVSLSIESGLIKTISFSGDFIGKLPPDTICAHLQGVRYDRPSLTAALSPLDIGSCFPILTPPDLADLILGQD